MDWAAHARAVIGEVHNGLPANATLAERRKALREAYPFGERAHWPYKAWCKAQREYLARFTPKTSSLKDAPLFSDTLPQSPALNRAGDA